MSLTSVSHSKLWAICLGLMILSFVAKNQLQGRLTHLVESGPTLYANEARFHARSLKQFSLGFQNLVADLLWIRLLQKARTEAVHPDKVSWEFAQLEAVTLLDPRFESVFPFGTAFLSVFLRDNQGAKILFKRWVQRHPRYWKAHYLLGYHLFFEMGENEPAAQSILTAASLPGAPAWLSSLGVRLLSESGELQHSLERALTLYPFLTNEAGRERLKLRIRSLNYGLQKKAWDEALAQYQKERGTPSSLREIASFNKGSRFPASFMSELNVPSSLVSVLQERFEFRYDSQSKTIIPSDSVPEDVRKIHVYIPESKAKELVK